MAVSRHWTRCAICGKGIPLEEAKSNADGKPVHSDCYLGKITDAMAKAPNAGVDSPGKQ